MKSSELSSLTASPAQSSFAPPMVSETVSTTAARTQLSAFVNRAAYGNEAIVLSRHGQPAAVLVSVTFFETCLGLLAGE